MELPIVEPLPIIEVSDEDKNTDNGSSSKEELSGGGGGGGGADNGSAAGYSSDLSPSSEDGGGGSGGGANGSSSDDEASSNSSGDDDDSIRSKINYIRQKGKLLQRVATVMAEEQRYNAAMALEMSRRACLKTGEFADEADNPESVWNEAKSVLRLISDKGSAGDYSTAGDGMSSSTSSSSLVDHNGHHRRRHHSPPVNPMDPDISLCTVRNLTSHSYNAAGEEGRRQHQHQKRQNVDSNQSLISESSVFGEGQVRFARILRITPLLPTVLHSILSLTRSFVLVFF